VGLNLVSAQTVYLLDPWWNPAVEEQAINRIHRIGQRYPVRVKHFMMSDSVEVHIHLSAYLQLTHYSPTHYSPLTTH
tara:strand:+ start:366 stop:596 length:231 start_codon:yes stop_codon:yes gene_type:complete